MTQPHSLHQLVHTLSYGDAISGEVLALQRCFGSLGLDSEIYAINVHPKLKGRALDYKLLETSQADQVLLHYSIGSPLNELYGSLQQTRRSMIFHNLTPAHWFAGVNPRIVADLEHGEAELPGLCRLTDTLVADSLFNARQLEDLGFPAKVLELPIDPQKWSEPANSGIAQMVQAQGGIHLLHVGRLAPNKCVEDVIKTFFFLHHKIDPRSRLWLVGIDIDTELYSFGLKRLVDELDLTDSVSFVGCLADSEVKALYQNCTAYLCMSEHEGFCLPVVEAMYFGLPVIAYASSAVPDTIGAGGILAREKRLPEIAELIARIAADSELRQRLVQAGTQRAAELSFERFSNSAAELFLEGVHQQAAAEGAAC